MSSLTWPSYRPQCRGDLKLGKIPVRAALLSFPTKCVNLCTNSSYSQSSARGRHLSRARLPAGGEVFQVQDIHVALHIVLICISSTEDI